MAASGSSRIMRLVNMWIVLLSLNDGHQTALASDPGGWQTARS